MALLRLAVNKKAKARVMRVKIEFIRHGYGMRSTCARVRPTRICVVAA